jgi:MFS family permease
MPLARAGRGAVARTPELDAVRPVRVNNLFQGFELKPMTNPHSEIPRFVYVAAGIAAIAGLIFGYDLVVISGAILFIKQQFALSPTLEEVVVSAVVLGALAGAAAGGLLADRFGRRVVLILIAVIFTLGRAGTFWLYSLLSIGAWIFAYRFVPETKGKSLEEIQATWAHR